FTSERHDAADGQSIYVTRLAGAVEIRDNDGKSVWKQDLCREPDPSQTPRHDYFDHYRFYMPELRPGWYKLEVSVEDIPTHRKAKQTLDLRVGVATQGS